MATLSAGQSINAAVASFGSVSIASNGGFGSFTFTPTGGSATTTTFGPGAYRTVVSAPIEGGTLFIQCVTGSISHTAQPGLLGRSSDIGHAGMPVVNNAATTFKANTLFQETLDLPCGIDSVQIGVASEATDVSTYTNVKVYTQTTDATGGGADLMNPYLAGAAQTMQSCTFGGAASPTFTAGTVNDPTYVWSDWTPVVNTGTGPSALIVRQWYPVGVANGAGYGAVNLYGGRSTTVNSMGGKSAYFSVVGADLGANNNVTTFGVSAAAIPVMVRFATQQNVTSILNVGDSTRAGWKANGSVAAAERYARAKSLAGVPTAVVNLAVAGQTTTQFLARLSRLAATGYKCDVLIYQVCSPNDDGGTFTAATSAKQIANAHSAIRLGAQMGAKVILDGPFPMSAGTPSAGAILCMNAAKAFCLSMSSIRPDVSCCLYEELHDSATYGKWVAAYNASGDGLHENELAVTAVILPKLTAALNAVIR